MALSPSVTSNQLHRKEGEPIMFYVANAKTPAKAFKPTRSAPVQAPAPTRSNPATQTAARRPVTRLQPGAFRTTRNR